MKPVLIVEDEAIMRESLRDWLNNEGYEVETVEEGEGINILAGLRATEPRFFPWTLKLNWNFDPDSGKIVDKTDLDAAYADLLDQDYD